MKESSISQNDELKELIGHIQKNTQIRYFIFGSFLLFELLLKWRNIAVPWIIIGLLTLLLVLNFFYQYLFKKLKPTVKNLSRAYLSFQVMEVIVMLAALHFFGAVAFGGMAVLMVYVIFCYFGFTRRTYPRIITLICAVGFITLASLEHYGILQYHDVQNLGVNVMQNKNSFLLITSFMVGFLICIAVYGDIFSKKFRDTIGTLKTKANQLVKKEEELSEAKASLEIRVEARTKELKELTEGLETEVKRRTGEVRKRMKELESFHKLAVGRELKMIELKKEIKRLKEELEKR